MVVVESYSHLFEIVAALHSPRSLAGGLNGRQQQRNENANDGNHNQQLHESERTPIAPGMIRR